MFSSHMWDQLLAAFATDSSHLMAAAANGTVHIFRSPREARDGRGIVFRQEEMVPVSPRVILPMKNRVVSHGVATFSHRSQECHFVL